MANRALAAVTSGQIDLDHRLALGIIDEPDRQPISRLQMLAGKFLLAEEMARYRAVVAARAPLGGAAGAYGPSNCGHRQLFVLLKNRVSKWTKRSGSIHDPSTPQSMAETAGRLHAKLGATRMVP
jgi:hypothetical protein